MKRFLFTLLGGLVLSPVFAAPENKAPAADQILASVRNATSRQSDQKLEGNVTKKKEKIPFGIELKKGRIYFSYSDDNSSTWKTFELRFKEKGQELFTYVDGKSSKFTAKRYQETIGNTDITFEDLSLRFLYWPNGKVLPESRTSYAKGRLCYVLDLPNPSPGTGMYAWIRVWVDKENGALWIIDAFNEKAQKLKRFSIESVKEKEGNWFFKQMKIFVHNPDTGKVSSVNYIDL